jgi:hypothetical protein
MHNIPCQVTTEVDTLSLNSARSDNNHKNDDYDNHNDDDYDDGDNDVFIY